jgi:hypothetical protein
MLQNRVDPFGNFIVTSARGSFMGNRGVIHKDKKIIKPFNHKAWIICVLEFKGRKRKVMTPDRWTELFFLDEATAFAAGHRPCFECRREDASRFKSCWIKGNPEHQFDMKTSVQSIDRIIHAERIDHNKNQVRHQRKVSDIPSGTFVLWNDEPHVFAQGSFHRWTPFGYEGSVSIDSNALLTVLTPRSIVNAFLAGYVPAIGGSSLTAALP